VAYVNVRSSCEANVNAPIKEGTPRWRWGVTNTGVRGAGRRFEWWCSVVVYNGAHGGAAETR
jgi:hypothetical protein